MGGIGSAAAHGHHGADAAIFVLTHSKVTENLLQRSISSRDFSAVRWLHDMSDPLLQDDTTGTHVLFLDHAFLVNRTNARALRHKTDSSPMLRVLVVGAHLTDSEIHRLLQSGVHGYLLLPKDAQLLGRAVKEVVNGGLWFPRSALGVVLRRNRLQCVETSVGSRLEDILTPREKVVARQVSLGLNNRQIANVLGISEKTVKLHLTRIYDKLGVSGRLQLSVLLASQATGGVSIV